MPHSTTRLDMYGFTESFNLSVASALVLQSLFNACPEAHGDLGLEGRKSLRREWYEKLNRKVKDPANLTRFEGYLKEAEAADERAHTDSAVAGPAMVEDLRESSESKIPTINKKLRRKMQQHKEESSRVLE